MAQCLSASFAQSTHAAHAGTDAVVFVRPKQAKLLHAKRGQKIVALAFEEIRRIIGGLRPFIDMGAAL